MKDYREIASALPRNKKAHPINQMSFEYVEGIISKLLI